MGFKNCDIVLKVVICFTQVTQQARQELRPRAWTRQVDPSAKGGHDLGTVLRGPVRRQPQDLGVT
jgi:hypothetical protein